MIGRARHRRRWARLILALGLLPGMAIGVDTPAPIEVIDDRGQTLRLAQPARRVLALSPHLVELAHAAGAGGQLVGRVEHADHPPAAKALPSVGDAQALNLEAILLRRPDLILAWWSGNPPDTIAALRARGLPVYQSEPRRLADILDNLEDIGRLSGHPDLARRRAAELATRIEDLRRQSRHARPLRVFYQLWDQPLITLGGPHLVSEVIRLCGGENLFARLDDLAPVVNREAVLLADPEVILVAGPAAARERWLTAWRRWPSLQAVRNGRLHGLDPDLLHRPGPRMIDGAAALCATLAD